MIWYDPKRRIAHSRKADGTKTVTQTLSYKQGNIKISKFYVLVSIVNFMLLAGRLIEKLSEQNLWTKLSESRRRSESTQTIQSLLLNESDKKPCVYCTCHYFQ